MRLEGPLTPSQLARRLGITTASVTELVDRLERARLTVRRPHPSDRRKLLINLTPRASSGVDRIYRDLEHVLAGAANLDERGQQVVTDFLSAAAAAIRADNDD